MWKELLIYMAAVLGLGGLHAQVDSKLDDDGLNGVDREFLEYASKHAKNDEEYRQMLKNAGLSDDLIEKYSTKGSYSNNGIASALGIGGSSIGKLIEAITNRYTGAHLTGAELEANEFSAGEAQKSRDFTEYMARNKYQMESQSMTAAGVNPAMMYGGGNLVSTAANGAAASSVAPATGDFFNAIMSMVRLPQEMKKIKAEAEKARKEGDAALINAQASAKNAASNAQNADTNARNAATNERLATVQELRQQVDMYVAETQIDLNNQEKDRIAAQTNILQKQFFQMDDYLDIAKLNASSQEKQAIAALKNAAANIQNAATNEYLSNYQTSLMYAQELLAWSHTAGQDITNKYLDEKTQIEIANLEKEGIKLDAEGRLIDKQGNLVTAQTVKTYVNCATDVANSVSRFVGIGALAGKAAPETPSGLWTPKSMNANGGVSYGLQ